MLEKQMRDSKFTLLVSLPKNDLEYAKAALEAGADGIKVHINAFHYASNQKYGSLESERQFLEAAVKVAKENNKVVGIVPGDDGDYASLEDFRELEKMGYDFISSYVHNTPATLLNHYDLEVCAALSPETKHQADNLDKTNVQIIEASIVQQKYYRTPLTVLDVANYIDIVSKSDKPVLIPTQKDITPEDIEILAGIGCKGVLLGAVVFKQDGVEHFAETIKEFRNAINKL